MIRRFAGLLALLGMGLPLGEAAGPALPRMDHVVVVIEENHSFGQILADAGGKRECPYLNGLALSSALLTQSYAVTHPSLPNYLALFSGSTQDVTDDDSACADVFTGPQLGGELLEKGLAFAGYSEDLPSRGTTLCQAAGKDGYYRKHNPWVYWQMGGSLPASVNRPFTDFPKGPDYGRLPAVSFVVPNEAHDMHNGTPAQADRWLEKNLAGYLRWAKAHNSLLIVTWDEDDYGEGNRIPTILAGAHVKPGRYGRRVTHYDILRTVEDMYGLKPLGESAGARALAEAFR